jgi:hypothetical protein
LSVRIDDGIVEGGTVSPWYVRWSPSSSCTATGPTRSAGGRDRRRAAAGVEQRPLPRSAGHEDFARADDDHAAR